MRKLIIFTGITLGILFAFMLGKATAAELEPGAIYTPSGWADSEPDQLEVPEPPAEPRRLDFSKSRFGTEHLTTDLCDSICANTADLARVAYAVSFIKADQPRADAYSTAEMMVRASKDYPLVPFDLALDVIADESSFLPHVRNKKSGAYGYWQLMSKWQRARMERQGWDWDNPEHNYRYGLWLITKNLAEQGITEPEKVTPQALYKALWPWEARPKSFARWMARNES